MIKILAIIRASTDRQELIDQEKEVIQFCMEKGFSKDEIKVLAKAGASARKLNSKYIQMLDEIKSTILNEGVKNVAFWHINRLGRVELKLIEMKDFFKEHGIQVYIKHPSIQLLNEDGSVSASANFMWTMMALSTEDETKEMFAKMKRGKMRNAEQGKYSGGKIRYGYTIDKNGYYVINENESEIIHLIYELYSSGKYSVSQLSKELSTRGVELDRHFIQVILTHSAYTGKNKHNGILRTYPRIISDELFNKCKSIRDKNKNSISKTERQDFALKLIKCPCCGHYYTHQMYAKSKNKIGGIYTCWNHAIDHKCNNALSISSYNLDRLLWYVAREEHIKYLASLDSDTIDTYRQQIKLLNDKIDIVKTKLEKVESKKKKVALNFENDLYTKDEYIKRLNDIKIEMKEYQTQLIDYSTEIDKLNNLIKSIEEKDNKLFKLIDARNSINITKKELNEIVHLHIMKVNLISQNKLNIIIEIIKTNGETITFNYFPRNKKKTPHGWYDKFFINDKSYTEHIYKGSYEYDVVMECEL